MTDRALIPKPRTGGNGVVPVGQVKPYPPRPTPPVDLAERRQRAMPSNQAEAVVSLDDNDYLAYCVREAVQQLYAMIRKRWPDFQPMTR